MVTMMVVVVEGVDGRRGGAHVANYAGGWLELGGGGCKCVVRWVHGWCVAVCGDCRGGGLWGGP